MAYGKLGKNKTTGAKSKFGRVTNRGTSPTNTRIFNSLPGEVVRVMGKYKGKSECVGGAREVVKDLPGGLFNYAQKLAIINSQVPEPGSAVIMPAGKSGHMGVVLSSDENNVYVYDVNADGKNTQMIRKVPKDKIDGYFKGKPENVEQAYITESMRFLENPITTQEKQEITQAEKDAVKFNTEKVIDELNTEIPGASQELGGIKTAVDQMVDSPGAWDRFWKREGELFTDQGIQDGALQGLSLTKGIDPFLGALKSLNRHLENGSVLMQKGYSKITAFIAEKAGFPEMAQALRENEPGRINPMIEKATGVPEKSLTTPRNGWQTAGGLLETIGEFAVTGKLAGMLGAWATKAPALSKLPASVKGLIQLGEVMGIEGGTAASTAALQEGRVINPETGNLDTNVKWSGILGAAIPAVKAGFSALKNLITPDINTLLYKAIRPYGVTQAEFSKNSGSVIQYLMAKHPGIKTIQEFDDIIRSEAKGIITAYSNGLKEAGITSAVNGNTVYQRIIDAFQNEKKLLREVPNFIDDYVKPFAEKYKGLIQLDETDDILKETNKILKNFYEKASNMGLGDAFKTDVGTKLQKALADALRQGIDDAVSVSDVPTALRPLREMWGKLANLGQQVSTRIPVFDRQALFNLPQGINIPEVMGKFLGAFKGGPIGAIESAGQLTATQMLKSLNSADGMIKTAFEKASQIPGLKEGIKWGTSALQGVLSQSSPQLKQDKETLQFESVKLPPLDAFNKATGLNIPTKAPGSDLMSVLVPSANASPMIPEMPKKPGIPKIQDATVAPEPAPIEPKTLSTANVTLKPPMPQEKPKFGVLSLALPKLDQQAKDVTDVINNLGKISVAKLQENAPKPEPKGILGMIQANKDAQKAQMDQIEGKAPPVIDPKLTVKNVYDQSSLPKFAEMAGKSLDAIFNPGKKPTPKLPPKTPIKK